MAGLRKRRNTAPATAPVPLSGNRCDTTWYRQWQTLFSCGGNLKKYSFYNYNNCMKIKVLEVKLHRKETS